MATNLVIARFMELYFTNARNGLGSQETPTGLSMDCFRSEKLAF